MCVCVCLCGCVLCVFMCVCVCLCGCVVCVCVCLCGCVGMSFTDTWLREGDILPRAAVHPYGNSCLPRPLPLLSAEPQVSQVIKELRQVPSDLYTLTLTHTHTHTLTHTHTHCT